MQNTVDDKRAAGADARACSQLARAAGRSASFALASSLCLLASGCGSDAGSGQPALAVQGGQTASAPPTAGSSLSAGVAGTLAAAAGRAASGASPAGRAASAAAGNSAVTSNAGAPGSAAGTGGSARPTSTLSAGSDAQPSAGGTSAGAAAVGGSAGTPAMPTAGAGAALDPKQTLIPHKSWDCGMPEGIPGITGQLVFDAELKVGEIHDIGETQYGHRHQIDITGGSVKGSKLNAEVLTRGLDYQLVLSNGAVEVEQINIFRAGDGALILARSCGTAAAASGDVRLVMDFEAPNGGPYAFLNTGKFVGTRELDPAAKTLKIHVYEAGAAEPANAVQVVEPDGVPDQSWACKVDKGTKGATVYTESVGIGGSLALGASKRGTRNIIPITGGTTTGRIKGVVLEGGADFQIIANGTFSEIDARYSLKTEDGEVLIVRNCGPLGALVPVIEARKDGKYAWANANNFLSSDPGLGLGSVNLTIYEKR